MADPLSITASIVGIATFALSSVRKTIAFIEGVRGAPSAVTALASDLNALEHVLGTLHELLSHPALEDNSRQVEFVNLLRDPLQQCVLTSHGISQKLKPYIRSDGIAKTSKWRGFSWFFQEKDLLELKRNLTAQKSALQIAVSVVNLYAVVQKPILNSFTDLSLMGRSNSSDIILQISSLRQRLKEDEESTGNPEFEGSSAQGSDQGYAIKRFLLETESRLGDSRPVSVVSVSVRGAPSSPLLAALPLRDLPAPIPEVSLYVPSEAEDTRHDAEASSIESAVLYNPAIIADEISTPKVSSREPESLLVRRRSTTLDGSPSGSTKKAARDYHERARSDMTTGGLRTSVNYSLPRPRNDIRRFRTQDQSHPQNSKQYVVAKATVFGIPSVPPIPPNMANEKGKISESSADPSAQPNTMIDHRQSLSQIDTAIGPQDSSYKYADLEMDDLNSDVHIAVQGLMSLPPGKVFGRSLVDTYNDSRQDEARCNDSERMIPMFVLRCIRVIESYGLTLYMIYSLSGRAKNLIAIKKLFDQEGPSAHWPFDYTNKPGLLDIAASLKQFLRELPEPLLTAAHYRVLLKAAQIEDVEDRYSKIRNTVTSINEVHFTTLKAICLHLRRIADHSDENTMTARNIAFSFGPTLMSNSWLDVRDINWHVLITETLITRAHSIFADVEEASETTDKETANEGADDTAIPLHWGYKHTDTTDVILEET